MQQKRRLPQAESSCSVKSPILCRPVDNIMASYPIKRSLPQTHTLRRSREEGEFPFQDSCPCCVCYRLQGGPRHWMIVQLEFFQYFSPCFRRIASQYLKLPGMIYSAIWQIVKDSINTASDSSLHNNVNQDDHHWNSEAH